MDSISTIQIKLFSPMRKIIFFYIPTNIHKVHRHYDIIIATIKTLKIIKIAIKVYMEIANL